MEARMIGLDLAKNVFQAHGADAAGAVVFRKRLRRCKVLAFFASQPACQVAMEACAGAHYWGRAIGKLGHTVRLIPPAYVKPFLKRQKNDAADAEAICEAAQRPTMRFVAVKSEEQQASVVVFRARDLLVQQRTQTINALRGHLAEYGLVVSKGPSHIAKLIAQVEDPQSRRRPAWRSLYWSKRCGRWSTASSGLMSRLHVVPGKTELLGGWQRSPALVRSQQRRWSRYHPHQPLSREAATLPPGSD